MAYYVDSIKLFHIPGCGYENTCSVCLNMGTSESPYEERIQIVGWDDDPDLEFSSDRKLLNDQLENETPKWSKQESCEHVQQKNVVAPKSYRTAEISLDDGKYIAQVTRFVYPELNGKMPLIPAATVGYLDLI